MADVQRLFEAYREAYPADPTEYLAQVSGRDRAELVALIDAFLERAPRRQFSAEAFRASPASRVAESVQRSLAGQSGMWPSLLPQLRNRARLKRADLVAELAARLGAEGQSEKVGAYYHQMEQGLLPASGVSDSVLEALGRIIGAGKEALRKAGRDAGGGRGRGGPGRRGVRSQLGSGGCGRPTWPEPLPRRRNGTKSIASSAAADRTSVPGPRPDLNLNERTTPPLSLRAARGRQAVDRATGPRDPRRPTAPRTRGRRPPVDAARARSMVGRSGADAPPAGRPPRRRDALSAYDRSRCNRRWSSTPSACSREVPDWIWDGKSLPVPVEHIADTWFGLHVRDVEDLRTAPGVPRCPPTRSCRGCCCPPRPRSG